MNVATNPPLAQANTAVGNEMRRRPTPSRILAHGACALLFWDFVIFGMGILGLILTGYQPIGTWGQSMQATIAGGSRCHEADVTRACSCSG